MSKELIKQRILKEKPKSEKEFKVLKRDAAQVEEQDSDATENFLQEDPNIFLLNNLLLTIQFFENFDRDVGILRENWFKEISLESHHKKCFYADSLFRESGAKIKFLPIHGINKNSKDFLHPLRIYISSDNMEAAFDPTNLGRVKKNVWPQYQFQIKMDENDEKQGDREILNNSEYFQYQLDRSEANAVKSISGSVCLTLFKILEQSKNRSGSSALVNENLNFSYTQRKSNNDTKEKKLTRTEKLFTSYNKEGRRMSSKCFKETLDDMIPPNSFYCFATPEESLNPVSIVRYRMNTTLRSNHEIPQLCFQKEVIKTTLKTQRKIPEFFRARKLLNAAAFKGHFCDLLIETLAEPLGFDVNDIQAGIVHEEFAILGQKMKTYICHAIEISDWNSFISLTKHRYNAKSAKEVTWPTNQMWEIINALPCYAVPNGVSNLSSKNQDHEKKWKIVFPKTEQFLLLHMMHSQIRCYLFILSIYKSFIEPEINTASLGPKHLLHLFFWQVHKNFLAWPEERPAETLLSYLRILYKKLQNKFLRDFLINSRNLFASSLVKDMHKAQALIKMILQNPVPYVLRAIINLEPDSNFYPAFKAAEVSEILCPINIIKNRSKKLKKEKIEKKMCFEDVEEHLCRKNSKQMQSILKAEEQTRKNSIFPINMKNKVNFDFKDSQKFSDILEIFIIHYIEMGSLSIEFKFLTQALMYLYRIQSLFELVSNEKLKNEDLKPLQLKINKLKEKCDELKREEKLSRAGALGKTKFLANPIAKLKSQQQQLNRTEIGTFEKQQKFCEKNISKIEILKKTNSFDRLMDQNEEWETKL